MAAGLTTTLTSTISAGLKRSPHPCLNMWGWLAAEDHKHGREVQRVDDPTWSNVPTGLLETLTSNVPQQLLDVNEL